VITLVKPNTARYDSVSKHKLRFHSVRSEDPAEGIWEVPLDLTKSGLLVHNIESIYEVCLKNPLILLSSLLIQGLYESEPHNLLVHRLPVDGKFVLEKQLRGVSS
jgi:hypothetical protein